MAKLVTQMQYAEMRGCTQQYISKLVQQGRVTLVNGKIDPELADKQIAETSDPTHPQNINKEQKNKEQKRYKQAKFKRLMYDTKNVKLEYEMRQNEWLDKQGFINHAFESGRMMRDQLLALSDRYGPLLFDIDGREAVLEQLQKEIDNIIQASEQRSLEYVRRHSI